MCSSILPACLSVHCVHAVPVEVRKMNQIIGNRVTDGCGCWDSKPGTLEASTLCLPK